MPGWYFTDWDPTDPRPAGGGFGGLRPHAVCNAWWQELCTAAGVPSDLDADEFDRAFWTGTAYRLIAGEPPDSPHATAAALGAGLGGGRREAGLAYLERESASGALAAKVTAYYAYFVARALQHRSRERALAFVREFYGPIAREYGTLYEKTSGDASLAHGWSVAVAALLVREP